MQINFRRVKDKNRVNNLNLTKNNAKYALTRKQ